MLFSPVDFLFDVWAYQPDGFGFVCSRSSPTSWRDQAVQLPDEDEDLWVPDDEGDVYFTPNVFRRPVRRREEALESRWLYADLDTVDPREVDPKLRPTVAWESSPGRYQAMWLVQTLPPDVHQRLNKQLTYRLGADLSGWDITQVLRVPGTLNHKYDDQPEVKLLWWEGRELMVTGSGMDTGGMGNGSMLRVVPLNGRIKFVPKWIRTKLRAEVATGDRSRALFRIECTLLNAGLTKDEVFTLVRPTVWNKFSDRQLSDEIHRVAERVK
jgi:RepB DNA-primase from phage plasmid